MYKNLLKSSFFVFILIVFGKTLSFLRDIVISSKFGSTYQTDAYFSANTIPSILFTAIISSYLILLIPIYKKLQTNNGSKEADYFISRLINIFGVISIILSVIGFCSIEFLIDIVAPGFNKETKSLAISLGKILVLSFPISSLALILSTISNANNKFYAPHIIPIFSASFVIIGVLLFSDTYGIYTLAVSGVLAFCFQLIFQIIIARPDFQYYPIKGFLDKNIKKMSWLILPVFLGFSVDQINLLVNNIICSNLSEGSLSSLNYAQRLQATINGTFSMALITVIYPLLSKLFAENKQKEFLNTVKKSFKLVVVLLLPIVVFLALNSEIFVSIIYVRGKFGEEALQKTSSTFFFYAFNVFFLSIREIILRLYYINNDTKTPLYASFLSLLINVVLSLILVKIFSVSGLSLANLIATFASTLLLVFLVHKKINITIQRKTFLLNIKQILLPILVFACFQLFVIQYVNLENYSKIIFFSCNFILSMIFYISLLILFKQTEVLKIYKKYIHKILK